MLPMSDNISPRILVNKLPTNPYCLVHLSGQQL